MEEAMQGDDAEKKRTDFLLYFLLGRPHTNSVLASVDLILLAWEQTGDQTLLINEIGKGIGGHLYRPHASSFSLLSHCIPTSLVKTSL
jgi:hypothetical protein